MNFLLFLSDAIIPLLIFSIVGYGLITKHNIYDDFIKGAKDGFETVIGIMPTLIGLMIGVGILRASGFLDFLASLIGTFTEPLHFPAALVPVTIVKMFLLLQLQVWYWTFSRNMDRILTMAPLLPS